MQKCAEQTLEMVCFWSLGFYIIILSMIFCVEVEIYYIFDIMAPGNIAKIMSDSYMNTTEYEHYYFSVYHRSHKFVSSTVIRLENNIPCFFLRYPYRNTIFINPDNGLSWSFFIKWFKFVRFFFWVVKGAVSDFWGLFHTSVGLPCRFWIGLE